MTTEEVAVSRPAEAVAKQVVACYFCRKRLADEYFFTCIKCDASYCYIHMSRHSPGLCARQQGRRLRAQALPATQGQGGLSLRHGNQLLLARSDPSDRASANV
jgi:hypothetical protein